MKTNILFLIAIAIVCLSACVKLDLDPLAQSSTGNFFSNQKELELAVNDLYRLDFWQPDNELFSDNFWHRAQGGNTVTYGTMDAEDDVANGLWTNAYKAIARANSFLENKETAADVTPESIMLRLEAEARLARDTNMVD